VEFDACSTDDPNERYGLEITGRESLGSNVIAPKLADGRKETWSYSLVAAVQPGDVVFHWWRRPGHGAIAVGFSTASSPAFSSRLTRQARGRSDARNRALETRRLGRLPSPTRPTSSNR
jgi:hypothetical protein